MEQGEKRCAEFVEVFTLSGVDKLIKTKQRMTKVCKEKELEKQSKEYLVWFRYRKRKHSNKQIY